MKLKLKEYMDGLFADAEGRAHGNPRVTELKEEMLQDLSDKYDDLVAAGRSPESAYQLAVSGIGDIGELLEAVIGEKTCADEGNPPEAETGAEPAERAPENEESAKEPAKESAKETAGTQAAAEDAKKTDEVKTETVPTKAPVEVASAAKESTPTKKEEGKAAPIQERPRRSRRCALVCGILWTVVLGIYLTVSGLTGAWDVTWLIILMGVAADNVTKGIFDLRR